MQLQKAKNDAMLRSNVLAIDRLVVDFKHECGGDESIKLLLFKDKNTQNPVQNLTVTNLTSTSRPAMKRRSVTDRQTQNRHLFFGSETHSRTVGSRQGVLE